MYLYMCVCMEQICLCGCVNKLCHIVIYFLICLITSSVSKKGCSRSGDRNRSKMAAFAGVHATN